MTARLILPEKQRSRRPSFLSPCQWGTKVEGRVDEAFRASPRHSLQPAEYQVVTGGAGGLHARWSHAPAAP